MSGVVNYQFPIRVPEVVILPRDPDLPRLASGEVIKDLDLMAGPDQRKARIHILIDFLNRDLMDDDFADAIGVALLDHDAFRCKFAVVIKIADASCRKVERVVKREGDSRNLIAVRGNCCKKGLEEGQRHQYSLKNQL